MTSTETPFSQEDLELLRQAKEDLEQLDLATRLTVLLGTPIERGVKLLPRAAADRVQEATRAALHAALSVATATIGAGESHDTHDRWHKATVAVAGGLGGALGLMGVAVELPVTTTVLFRSMLEIARSEGEEIDDVKTRVACLEVFALGGPSPKDNSAETGYYAVRVAMARVLSQAAEYLGSKGLQAALTDQSAPLIAKLIARIGSRFGAVVMETVAAGAVPVVGAVSGAAVNLLFAEHYQRLAHAHFRVRRLERRYGRETVQGAYTSL